MQQLHTEQVTDALLAASTALVAIAARSIADAADHVTMPQFRALVVLTQDDLSMTQLAHELDCSPSAATRLCDRLVRKKLIARESAVENRREVRVVISHEGRCLVEEVLRRRRAEIKRIVDAVPQSKRPAMVDALKAFTQAATHRSAAPSQSWSTGWRVQ